MLAKYYDLDGHEVDKEPIKLDTKSIYKASILVEQKTGCKVIRMSFNWCLMGKCNQRLIVSAVDGQ